MKKPTPMDDLPHDFQASFREDIDHAVDRMQPLWSDLAGKRLFVTGGTGFFGRWLLETATTANRRFNLGLEIWVLSSRWEAFKNRAPALAADPAIHGWSGDVRDYAFPPGRFSHVIHAASLLSQGHEPDPQAMLDVIEGGTRRTLEFAAQAGVERFLFVSSGAVYGPQPPDCDRLAEDCLNAPDPLDARSTYGLGKRAAEHLCALAQRQHGFPITIARCFAFVGPHLPTGPGFAVLDFIRDALEHDRIRVNGDGTALRSYLYAGDLAVWLWTLLLRGQAGQAYNVGGDQAVSIAELANMVSTVLAPETPVSLAKAPQAMMSHRARYLPDVGKARRELGLEAWTDLPTALRRTAAWYQDAQSR